LTDFILGQLSDSENRSLCSFVRYENRSKSVYQGKIKKTDVYNLS